MNKLVRDRYLLALLLVLITVRTLMVVLGLWSPLDGGDLIEANFGGNLGFDILNGTWRGWEFYLYFTYGHLGNEVMMGVLALPLFYLFGPSLFVLSLVPTIFAVLVTVLIYYFCNTYVSKRAARIAAFLYVLAPLEIQNHAILTGFAQFESSFFSLSGFLLFFALLSADTTKRKVLFAIFLGLISGLGLFQYDPYLFTLAVIGIFWLAKDRLLMIRPEFFVCVAAFVIGMIPYLYFGVDVLIEFLTRYSSGLYAKAHDPIRAQYSLTSTFELMSVWFWPIRTFTSFLHIPAAGATILAAGWLVLCGLESIRRWRINFTVAALTVYCMLYAVALIKTLASMNYYGFPPFAHMMILLAVGVDWTLRRFKAKKLAVTGVVILLALVGSRNLYKIFRDGDFSNFPAMLEERFVARGYNFYYPFGYRPYSGYKTQLGQTVEGAMGGSRDSRSGNFFGFGTKVHEPNRKYIYRSPFSDAFFPLNDPAAYYLYAIDLTFEGFSKTAANIAAHVPPDQLQKAYGGMAVFLANDYLLQEVLQNFRSGRIENEVPGPFRPLFYKELGRKLRQVYRPAEEQKISTAEVDAIMARVPFLRGEQAEWTRAGMRNSAYVKFSFCDCRPNR